MMCVMMMRIMAILIWTGNLLMLKVNFGGQRILRFVDKKTGTFEICHHKTLQHYDHHGPSQLGFGCPHHFYIITIISQNNHHSTTKYFPILDHESDNNIPSDNIIAITLHLCHSPCNMMHRTTSSPSDNIIAITNLLVHSPCNMMHHTTS